MSKFEFPHVQKTVDDFLSDEEGNIPMSKVLTIGSMIMILGILFAEDVFAEHSSHRSHSSHSSHSSGGGGYGHSSHVSHSSHSSHQSGMGGGGYDDDDASSTAAAAPAHASHNNVAPDAATMESMQSVPQADNMDLNAIQNVDTSPADVPTTTGGKGTGK